MLAVMSQATRVSMPSPLGPAAAGRSAGAAHPAASSAVSRPPAVMTALIMTRMGFSVPGTERCGSPTGSCGLPLLLSGADQHLVDRDVPGPGHDVGDRVGDVLGLHPLPELAAQALEDLRPVVLGQ